MMYSTKGRLLWLLLATVAATTTATASATEESTPTCEADPPRIVKAGTKVRDNARFPLTFQGDWEKVIASPEVQVIADSNDEGTDLDIIWTEGPLVRESSFYFADTVRAIIYKITDGHTIQVWATQSGGIDPDHVDHQNDAEPGSNGMATDVLDPRFVVINQHGLRRVVRCRLDDHSPGAPLAECPDLEILTDSFADKPYNSPNDVIVHPHDGSVWFTDPIYGFLEKHRFCDELSCSTGSNYLEGKSSLGWQGVYRLDRDTQTVELVTNFHRRPNGLAFTPDLKQLWVADSTIGNPSWTAYDVSGSSVVGKATGVLNPATLGALLGRTEGNHHHTGGEGLADGIKIDEQGYMWTSVPNGFAVIDLANREVVCQILLGINNSNVAFGPNGEVWLTGLNGVWKIQRKLKASQVA